MKRNHKSMAGAALTAGLTALALAGCTVGPVTLPDINIDLGFLKGIGIVTTSVADAEAAIRDVRECGVDPSELVEQGTLTVGLLPSNSAPLNATKQDGSRAGIDVEVAQAIADKLGMELEVTDIAFDSIIPGIQTGKYDMGMAGMTVTDERKEQVNFSDSYATGVQVVIVKDDSAITSVDDLFADGANTVVGTQAGTTGFIYATSDIEDAGLGTVKSFGKTTDAVEALKNGQVDCVVLDNEPAKALVAANEGLHILDTEYAVEDYAIAIAKENTDLLEKVNKALSELTADGTLQSIVDKYIGK